MTVQMWRETTLLEMKKTVAILLKTRRTDFGNEEKEGNENASEGVKHDVNVEEYNSNVGNEEESGRVVSNEEDDVGN